MPPKHTISIPQYYRGVFENKIVELYDLAFLIITLGQVKKLRRAIVRAITNNPKEILDLATGTGGVAIEIKRRFPNANIVGIDLSNRMLEIAKRKAKRENRNIKFIQRNIEKTSFQNKFDAVTISFAFHELPEKNRRNVIKEAYKLLKNNGIFVLMDYSMSKNLFLKITQSLFINIVEPPYARTILYEDFEKEFREIGFRKIKKETMFHEAVQLVKGEK